MFSKNSLRRSKKIYFDSLFRFQKKSYLLSPSQKKIFDEKFSNLKKLLLEKKRAEASHLAKEIQSSIKLHLPKNIIERTFDFIYGFGIALFLAILIRQMGFELYIIPSGSMRPTVMEGDLLLVTKTPFGINYPTPTSHIYFNPSLVKRGEVVVFSGQDMDIPDVDTRYFYLIPGKKQFVKRLIGKPGDLLYFYGGKIYGIDKNGKEIREFLDPSSFSSIEHIPMIKFEGKMKAESENYPPIIDLYQMNQKLARITLLSPNVSRAEILDPKVINYFDFFGMKNYAEVRILTSEDLFKIFGLKEIKDSLYLELRHHPTLDHFSTKKHFLLNTESSFLPLNEEAKKKIFDHLYTCRFIVKNKKVFSLSYKKIDFIAYEKHLPSLNVEDGTYEILNGKAYKIYPLGFSKKLPLSHALNQRNDEMLKLLFNLGIEFNRIFEPKSKEDLFPPRYGYFREGDFYLLNSQIYAKNDPILVHFIQKEKLLKHPFIDEGLPLKEGKLDLDFLKVNGLKIPEKSYLVLGDNHAMSADSREFGFVKEKNLRGAAALLFFPFSSRMGTLPEPSPSYFKAPTVIFWSISLTLTTLGYLRYRRKHKL